MKYQKFAWMPTVIKTGSGKALIWLQSYQLKRYDNFPILCECQECPCEHAQKRSGFYKMPADYKRLGFFTIEF